MTSISLLHVEVVLDYTRKKTHAQPHTHLTHSQKEKKSRKCMSKPLIGYMKILLLKQLVTILNIT
jgi:hypothetical protein